MAVADKPNALERVANDPVSRRNLLAVTGGSTALTAGAVYGEPAPEAFRPGSAQG